MSLTSMWAGVGVQVSEMQNYLTCSSIQICTNMGWRGDQSQFDILPLVLQANGKDPELFDIPPELVLQVHFKHPKLVYMSEYVLTLACDAISIIATHYHYHLYKFSKWKIN